VTGSSGVLLIAGPTASGKTELAITLAQKFDAEIVNADSRQIYRGMPIGTAAPTPQQLAAVRHHLFGFLDPSERYSAARYSADAVTAIAQIHARGKRAIVVGGTGFYVRALTGAVDLAPQYDEAMRERLVRETHLHDAGFLHAWLSMRDRARAAAIHPQDSYRVLRALEVALTPQSARREGSITSLRSAAIPFVKLFLTVDEETLRQRIGIRTDAMLQEGFVEEAERIGADAVAASAVGYPQAIAFARGWCTRDELRELLIRATRRYAKRQMTWFRSEPQIVRALPQDIERLARESLQWVEA
jgi:tRNA dimethylallyltransferase